MISLKALEILFHPFACDLEYMVSTNNIDICTTTIHNVKNAHATFCPDIAGLRGKTVRHNPDHVMINYVSIPRYFLKLHKYVTLVDDVIFVNNILFLVSILRGFKFITVEYIPARTAKHLSKFEK